MKILDRYILTSYLKTFFSVFIILMFIFVLQTIWLYIGELAGKDLDMEVIFKFLLYFSPKLIPLVLPLTILLTSIMTFGSFAENYEFAAMKSSGISLQRAMRGLTVFIVFVSVVAFFFANNVIPEAEFKSKNLRINIAHLKPAMAITEGVFNDIGNINIKVADKHGENGRYLTDVIIHKKDGAQGNHTVIKAEEGELIGTPESDVLSLILKNGNYYDEIQPDDFKKRQRKPFTKSYFDKYIINIDLSSFNNVNLDEENYDSGEGMLKISELRKSIDSFSVSYNDRMEHFEQDMYLRSGITNLNRNFKPKDTTATIGNTLLDSYDSYDASQIANLALGTINSNKAHLSMKKQEFKVGTVQLNKFEIALHEKYVLAVACIVLFFVGAPLGAIIRKGGMGLPIVVAVFLFLTYHFIGIFAKNSAEDGSISPFIATWLSTLIMLPLGIFLTYRATTDQGLFTFDLITESIGNLFSKLGLSKIKEKRRKFKLVSLKRPVNIDKEEKEKIQGYSNEKLMEIVKYHRKYKLSEDYRLAALQVLASRGITQQDLRKSGNLYDEKYVEADMLFESILGKFKTTNILFVLIYFFIFASSVFKVKFHMETVAIIALILALVCTVFFYLYLFSLDTEARKVDELLEEKNLSFTSVFLFLGIVLYFLYYFQYKEEIRNLLRVVKSSK